MKTGEARANASLPNPYMLLGPCDECPFRPGGVTGLRAGRIQSIRNADDFACHKTTGVGRRAAAEAEDDGCDEEEDSEEDGPPADRSKFRTCGGWLAMLWRHDGGFGSLVALSARLGMFDPKKLRTGEVYAGWDVMIEAHTGAAPGEPCSVVEEGCEHPAGWSGGGDNLGARAPYACNTCGNPVCGNEGCSSVNERGQRICTYCQER